MYISSQEPTKLILAVRSLAVLGSFSYLLKACILERFG